MTKLRAAALLLLASLAPPAAGQETFQVQRGSLDARVRVLGTVIAGDLLRLKSTINGRVETVLASTGAWMKPDQDLGLLATTELSAMLDARGNTQQSIIEERWKKVWQPTRILCPQACFVLKSFIQPKLIVKPKTLLFETAQTLRMVGRVRPEDASWVRDGQQLNFWSVSDPDKKYSTYITRYMLDIQGETAQLGGTFTIEMSPSQWLAPGTAWEGIILPPGKKDVLLVPNSALIRHGPDLFLPVRVSAGVTTPTMTEITDGVEENRRILILDASKLKEASRHRPAPAHPPVRISPEAPPESAGPSELQEPGANLREDPYAE